MEYKSKRLTFEELSKRLREYENKYGYSTIGFTAGSKAGNWEMTTINDMEWSGSPVLDAS